MECQEWVQRFIKSERLPSTYTSIAHDTFIPFAEYLVPSVEQHRLQGAPIVIGVNGAQGTGKTTFAKFLTGYLTEFYGLNGSQISLDDFYLTRSEREKRARDVHPLFLTRGVPGTHDTELALSTISNLKTLKADESLALPSFDKASDDRIAKQDWPVAKGVQDFVIFEGWCVGARPVPAFDLKTPINSLEVNEDPSGIWRTAVNQYLAKGYQAIFTLIDILVFLKAPDFETVFEWRSEQEEKLALAAGPDQSRIMSTEDIANFIQYFERITRENLRTLPNIADHVFEFDRGHQIISRIDNQT